MNGDTGFEALVRGGFQGPLVLRETEDKAVFPAVFIHPLAFRRGGILRGTDIGIVPVIQAELESETGVVFAGAGIVDFLLRSFHYAACKTCKALDFGRNDDLRGLAVGSFGKCFEAL